MFCSANGCVSRYSLWREKEIEIIWECSCYEKTFHPLIVITIDNNNIIIFACGFHYSQTSFIWVNVFKNGPSKICERQPLNNFTWSILEYHDPFDNGN